MKKMTLFFCFVSAFLIAQEKQSVPLDELSIRALLYHTSNKGQVLLTHMLPQGFRSEVILVDMKEDAAQIIDDGRMQVTISMVMATESGFALLDYIKKSVFHVDRSGAFVRSQSLDDFEGWQSTYKLRMCFPESPGVALLTLQDIKEPTWLVFRIFLNEGRLEHLHSEQSNDEFRYRWFSQNQKMFRMNGDTGEIVQLDSQNFSNSRVIRRGAEPVERKPRRPRRSRYLSLLDTPTAAGGKVYFSMFLRRDKFGNLNEEVSKATLVFDGATFTQEPWHTMGVLEDRRLVWVWKDQELVFKALHPE